MQVELTETELEIIKDSLLRELINLSDFRHHSTYTEFIALDKVDKQRDNIRSILDKISED